MNIKNRIFVSLAVFSIFSILISFHGCGEETRMTHVQNDSSFLSATVEKITPVRLNPAAVNLKAASLKAANPKASNQKASDL